MAKYYFTFGSWKNFPYQNTFLIVYAPIRRSAIAAYRKKHPDLHEGTINCSDCYSEYDWITKIEKQYAAQKPAEIIYADDCYGTKPEGYGDLFLFVPSRKQILEISKGANKEEATDHISYSVYDMVDRLHQKKAGEIALNGNRFREMYHCTADCIPAVLAMAYGTDFVDAQIITQF